MTTTLLWFRQDLRLADNPALIAAAEAGPVVAVYVLDDAAAGAWRHGAAQRWWLHHSLAALSRDLRARGVELVLLRGDAVAQLSGLAGRLGAGAIHAGRLYEHWARARDAALAAALPEGCRLVLHTSGLLHEPHRLRTGQGRPYMVYTPFSRAVFALGEPAPALEAPSRIAAAPPPPGLPLEALALLPRRDWAAGFPAVWQPGEAGAAARMAAFGRPGLAGYDEARNLPGQAGGTSGLSPHLRFGEVSPRQLWHAARAAGAQGMHTWLKEILWREFSYHLLWHRPEMVDTALAPAFAKFPWQPDARLLRAWQKGETGYPIIDAGMRQLWATGWMHNRVRMITASFLTKHLLQPWQEGAAWFWDTLVDGDLASNSASWQWVAGCGADAAPYFRVFNPVLQGEKFDADGAYVRAWVPEVAGLPAKFLHQPWAAPRPPRGYATPVMDHAEGRARALAAYATLKAAG